LALSTVLYRHRTQGKGVEGVHIRSVTDALRAQSVRVDVLSMPGADPYASDQTMSPTRQKTWLMKLVARLPEPVFELAELGYNLPAWRQTRQWLSTNGPVDMIYERYAMYLFVTVWLANRRGIPIVLEVNDSACVQHRVRPLFFQKMAKRIERWIFNKADGLVFVSTRFKDLVADGHGKIAPSIVSPNAANIDQFSFSVQTRERVRQELKLGDAVVCGYLGAFNPWHSIDQFVYAISNRLKTNPKLKFLLVGDGITFDAVKDYVDHHQLSEQIVLTGRVPHAQVPELLCAMDMAILPSAGDYTSPVKLFEFMACSVPALAPDLAPILEVLREDETGWIFPADNFDAAMDKLQQLSEDTDHVKQVGAAARTYIADHRQWSHNAIQLIEFHNDLKTSAV
jgi:glycosyltransferase involved in cell wall biosynthesis